MVVPLPTEVLLGEAGRFDNELSAAGDGDSWCRPFGNDADMSASRDDPCFCGQRLRCSCPSAWHVLGVFAMTPKLPNHADPRTAESAAIFKRYAAKLEAIAALYRAYYATCSPSLAQRAEYYQRQAVLERIRLRLYSELGRVRQRAASLPVGLPR